jgi:hypothetical protein
MRQKPKTRSEENESNEGGKSRGGKFNPFFTSRINGVCPLFLPQGTAQFFAQFF